MSLIRFDISQIEQIAAQTSAHQAEWDGIWNDVRLRLSGVVSDALDAHTGMSLEERTARYHQRSAVYTQQLHARAAATSQVGVIAQETNVAMAKTLRGG